VHTCIRIWLIVQDIETTLSTRILYFLLRTSSNQLVSNRVLRTQLLDLRTHLRESLERQKALIGFNLAAMKFVKQRWESEKMAGVMDEQDDEKVRAMMGKGRAKRKRVEVRA
jgi:U3 small nucleolar RNA-associated protein 12